MFSSHQVVFILNLHTLKLQTIRCALHAVYYRLNMLIHDFLATIKKYGQSYWARILMFHRYCSIEDLTDESSISHKID